MDPVTPCRAPTHERSTNGTVMKHAWNILRAGLAAWVLCSASSAVWAQHAAHPGAPAQAAASAASAASAPKAARKPRPQLGTGAAWAADGRLWWVGVQGNQQLVLQRSASVLDDAAASGKPVQWQPAQVLDTGSDPISADGENHPKLLMGPDGLVIVAYTMPLPKPNTGFVRLLRSTDGGQTFAPPITVHADRQEITHRFESLGFDRQGILHAVWIDKRDLEAAPRVGGKSSYRGAAIYTAQSRDGGASFGPDTKLADHSCECCRIALATGRDGKLRAMWRHVFEPNVRDHALAVLDGTPTPPLVRATWDDWKVDGCPHHGPALAPAQDGGFHTVWFGIRQGQSGVRYARLRSDGSPVATSVTRIGDDRAEHADLAVQGARVAIVWRSTDGQTTRIKAWLSSDGGNSFAERVVAEVEGENDFPRIVQRGDTMAVVWRTTQEVQFHVLTF